MAHLQPDDPLPPPLQCLPPIGGDDDRGMALVASSSSSSSAAAAAAAALLLTIACALVAAASRRRRARERPSPKMHHHCCNRRPRLLADKIDFLERVGRRYGYADSPRGFVDDWRSYEFPTLIPPVELPASLRAPRREGRRMVRCSSSLAGRRYDNYDDDGRRRRSEEEGKRDDDREEEETEVYLDHAGSSLPTRTMLERTYRRNRTMILANPHSEGGGLASDRTRELMRRSEERVLRHFGIRGDDCNLGLDELNVNVLKTTQPITYGSTKAAPSRIQHSHCSARPLSNF